MGAESPSRSLIRGSLAEAAAIAIRLFSQSVRDRGFSGSRGGIVPHRTGGRACVIEPLRTGVVRGSLREAPAGRSRAGEISAQRPTRPLRRLALHERQGLGADMVLDAFRLDLGGLATDTEGAEEFDHHLMALAGPVGDRLAGVGEEDRPVRAIADQSQTLQ